MNKKILLSVFLVLLVAISVSAVAAEDVTVDDTVIDDVTVEEVAADNAVAEDIAVDDAVNDKAALNDPKTINVDEETADAIQAALDEAADGDTISLKENGVFDVASTKFTVSKNVTIKGNGATINVDGVNQNGKGATFICAANGTSFENIKFVNTNGPKYYPETISGVAIELAISYGTVSNCQFLDFSSGVYGRGASHCTITGCYFNGSSTKITNDGNKEAGTKAINLMGCDHITVDGNIFEGQVLDGVSLASSSGFNNVINNQFINNSYAIYFGGASTKGCTISGNTFTNCGWCYNYATSQVIWKNLPVISIQKAADGVKIENNNFIACEGSILIKAESGNTAHGYPSAIGDLNITGNTITTVEDAIPETITFVYIFSNSGPLNPYAPIAVTGNTMDAGITPVTVWYADWGNATGNVTIPAASLAPTFISIEEVATADGRIVIKLQDTNGDILAGKTINYTVNGEDQTPITTNEEGLANIAIGENAEIIFTYAGDSKTQGCTASISFTSTASPKLATEIVYEDMETTAVDGTNEPGTGAYFTITLKDSEGTLLANKDVQFGFNGKIYNKTTDDDGKAQLQINLQRADIYTFAVNFAGDDSYNSSFAVAKITVKKQTPTLTVPNKSYKASAKTKTLTATFKSAKGTLIAGKKVTFTVNGKTYTATTDAKGVASVNVSLSAKKTYSFTAKFAGDNTYAAVTKTGKVTIK